MTSIRRWPRGDSRPRLAIGFVLLGGLAGCESDVAVHLLPNAAACIDGEPCSGPAVSLSFAGAYDRVEVASSSLLDFPADFSFEAWVYVRSYDGGHGILNRWLANTGDIQLTVGTPEPVAYLQLPSLDSVPSHVVASWAFLREGRWLTAVAPTLPTIQHWHHLATSYGGGSFRLYVDGTLADSMASTQTAPNPDSTLFIGATARHERTFDARAGTLYWPPIDGFIAEVRLSDGDRYRGNFVPPPRLVVDAETIALWHLDEGDGKVAVDSGPHKLDGEIIGASWAAAPARDPSSSR